VTSIHAIHLLRWNLRTVPRILTQGALARSLAQVPKLKPPGFHCFISTTAWMSSCFGPGGSGRLLLLEANDMRYCWFFSSLWRRRKVEGFRNDGGNGARAGRMKRVHKPARIPFAARRLGARLRPRLRISSGWPGSTDSANYGTEVSGPREPDCRDHQMNQKNDNIAHLGILTRPPNCPILGQCSNSP